MRRCVDASPKPLSASALGQRPSRSRNHPVRSAGQSAYAVPASVSPNTCRAPHHAHRTSYRQTRPLLQWQHLDQAIIEMEHGTLLSLPEFHDPKLRDSERPGTEVRPSFELRRSPPKHQIDLMQHIIRIIGISSQRPDKGMQLPLHPSHLLDEFGARGWTGNLVRVYGHWFLQRSLYHSPS